MLKICQILCHLLIKAKLFLLCSLPYNITCLVLSMLLQGRWPVIIWNAFTLPWLLLFGHQRACRWMFESCISSMHCAFTCLFLHPVALACPNTRLAFLPPPISLPRMPLPRKDYSGAAKLCSAMLTIINCQHVFPINSNNWTLWIIQMWQRGMIILSRVGLIISYYNTVILSSSAGKHWF